MNRLLRRLLLARLSQLRHGRLTVRDGLGVTRLGTPEGGFTDLDIHIDVLAPRFYRAIAGNGSVGAGEAYMDGLWHCEDLVGLIRLLLRNRHLVDDMETGLARLGGLAMRAVHGVRRNTHGGSRRNVAAHYDLGNEFFALFLSPDLMYSAAYWTDSDATLEQASTRKLELICRKLALHADDRVVEVGTGWGGFAVYAAQHYGCHVTTTTISQEQYAMACKRVAEAGVEDRVEVLLKDYRDLEGQYDKLVSIEMIEAVGAKYLDTYFGVLQALLKPDGLALLQMITIEDHRYQQALHAVDFIQRYIFPGGFVPSINAMLAAKTRSCDLGLVGQEDFGVSYAHTLYAWRQRFLARLDDVRKQGFDATFIRMWDFYLAYCEGGFRERAIGVSHLLLARPEWRPGQTSDPTLDPGMNPVLVPLPTDACHGSNPPLSPA